MDMHEMDARECRETPEMYKTCGQWTCVPVNVSCPCKPEEFSCSDDTCIPQSLLCNGVKECNNGNDELMCNNSLSESLAIPLPVFIAVVAVCVLFCAIVVVLCCICLRRRKRKSNGSLTSNVLLTQSSEKDNVHDVCESKNKPCAQVNGKGSDIKRNPHRNYGYEKVPQDFGIFFGDEFLGTSTPKQGIKHIVNPKRFSGNVDIKDQMLVNQSLNSNYSDFRNGVQRPHLLQARAIGDSVGDLNASLFLPIT